MINVYGIALDRLRGQEKELLETLPDRIRIPWQTRHPRIQNADAYLASLAGVWLLWKSGIDGTLAYEAQGKPYLLSPDRAISITHTQTHAFCAASDTSEPIGLDAEDLGRFPADRLSAFALRWFTDAERESWERNPTEEAFLTLWTHKEATVKLTGEGLRAIGKTNAQNTNLRTYVIGRTLVTLASSSAQSVPDTIKLL